MEEGSRGVSPKCANVSSEASLVSLIRPLFRFQFVIKWDRVAELMMIKFGESGHPVFRATSPLSRGTLKSKGGGKLSIHFCADGDKIETVFRTIISVNLLSIYGAVSDLCEEYSSCQTRTGRLVVAEQSDPLFAPADLLIMTPTFSFEIPAQENLLQKHKERVEKLPENTHAGRTIRPIVSAKKFVDEKHLHLPPMILRKKIFATVPRTSGKAISTKSCDQDLY